MRLETRHHRHRRELLEAGFTDQWRQVLAGSMGHWNLLDDDERQRLGDRAVQLMAAKRWEAAKGFEISDPMAMLIAAEAALLVLERPGDNFDNVNTIVVHPSTMVLTRSHSQVQGVASDDPMSICGQATSFGTVVLAWDTAASQARHPERGGNVVLHEFAHTLDMLTGTSNGTPPMASAEAERQWVAACTAAYGRVATGQSEVLPPYAGVNTAEFFAVATEVFFTTPHPLVAAEPELYAVLADFYGQDPASRTPR